MLWSLLHIDQAAELNASYFLMPKHEWGDESALRTATAFFVWWWLERATSPPRPQVRALSFPAPLCIHGADRVQKQVCVCGFPLVGWGDDHLHQSMSVK